MRRILLVLEDYNELIFLETLLKKVGFDVDSIRNESSLPEKMMEFPDLVIATGDGYKVNGVRVSKKVKKKGSQGKLLLLYPRHKLPEKQVLDAMVVDGVTESPLNPRVILTAICELTGVITETIIAKFERLPIAKDFPPREELRVISGQKKTLNVDHPASSAPRPQGEPHDASQGPGQSAVPDVVRGDGPSVYERKAKYAEALKNVPPASQDGFKKTFIKNELAEIRKNGESEAIKKLDEERKDFVKALFKKDKA